MDKMIQLHKWLRESAKESRHLLFFALVSVSCLIATPAKAVEEMPLVIEKIGIGIDDITNLKYIDPIETDIILRLAGVALKKCYGDTLDKHDKTIWSDVDFAQNALKQCKELFVTFYEAKEYGRPISSLNYSLTIDDKTYNFTMEYDKKLNKDVVDFFEYKAYNIAILKKNLEHSWQALINCYGHDIEGNILKWLRLAESDADVKTHPRPFIASAYQQCTKIIESVNMARMRGQEPAVEYSLVIDGKKYEYVMTAKRSPDDY